MKKIVLNEKPYKHFTLLNAFKRKEIEKLREYLYLNKLEWDYYDYHKDNAYRYNVLTVTKDTDLYKSNKKLFNHFIDKKFINTISRVFNKRMLRCVDISLHEMKKNDYTSRHSDNNDFGEIIRLTLMISRKNDYSAGHFVIYDNKKKVKRFKINQNLLFGFKMTQKSFHEVEKIKNGIRYNIVVSYAKE